MTVCPKDEGKCMMKSVVSSSHSWVGMGMGWSRPKGF